ncbi:MAG TPA: LysM peptidoglycan-binding domain-containing protein [Anaerolineae bacterium]|nr:LysM peptidoglycan-binding domain-containing protein [Anaerolineae bacterium]
MQLKHSFTWFTILALLLAALPGVVSAAPVTQPSQNLLTNPGFEGDYVAQSGSVVVAPGWTPWWIPHQADQPDFMNRQPNFEATAHPQRVHGGAKAQSLASFYETHTAGVHQRVNVAAGADLRFSAFGKGWTSDSDDPLNTSVNGTDLRMRIGIDPTGGTDPLSPSVQWSQQVNAADSWVRFEAYVKAQSGAVTVFLYSAPADGRRHNDVYWDDAELVSLAGDAAATAQAHYPTPTPTPIIFTPTPVTVAIGQNLLKNPGFEGSWFNPCSWKGDLPWNHVSCTPWYEELMVRWDTVYTPESWTAWWQPPITDTARSDFYTYPNRCPRTAPETCVPWHNPEFGGTDWIRVGPSRIHSGKNSLKYFTFWSIHEGGVFQTVEGIAPGTQLRFSAYMHAWAATEGLNKEEPSPFQSAGQTSMHMKIGIDPTGGRNPWSADIVWSPEFDSYDQFGYYQVTATASANKVTVFTYSRPEKDLKHNDLYVDDVELVAVSIPPGAAAPVVAPTQPPAANPPPPAALAAQATVTPRPDGSLVHIVQPGDTLWALSLQYGVSMDQIMQLNGIGEDTLLQLGQELVIALPGSTAPTAPPPQATVATGAESTPTPEAAAPVAAPNSGKLCVRAYTDANGNSLLDAGENLVGGVVFILQDAQNAVVATRTSDGLSEPYCFEQSAGNYFMLVQVPAGRKATSDTRWGLALPAGGQIDIDFGSQAGSETGNSVITRASAADDTAGRALGGILGIAFVALSGAGLAWLIRSRSRVVR